MDRKSNVSIEKEKKTQKEIVENQETTSQNSSTLTTQEESSVVLSSSVLKRKNVIFATPGPVCQNKRSRRTDDVEATVEPATLCYRKNQFLYKDEVPAGCSKDPVYMALEPPLAYHENIQENDGKLLFIKYTNNNFCVCCFL